jgi:tripartite-type tricarboxylate transporter receptor subunit TctC
MFKIRTGIDLSIFHTRAAGQAISDLVGGQTHLMFATPIEVMPQVHAGRLKVLATTSPKRLAAQPDVRRSRRRATPDSKSSHGSASLRQRAPRRRSSTASPPNWPRWSNQQDVKDKLAGQSAQVMLRPGEEYAAFIAAEKAKWETVVKASGAKID